MTGDFFAIVSPGLEAVCAGELVGLGMADVRIRPGGVDFGGEWRDLYRANLHLRTASRVLVRVGEVKATDFPELFRKSVRLPWGRFIRPGTPVQVKAVSRGSRLVHTGRIAETIGASVDRALGRGPLPGDRTAQRILARFEEDLCVLSVDSSGELLHRRGYRQDVGAAPLRETLAAGVLLLLGWKGEVPLVDPLCGSGTFLIEGGLLAFGRSPGRSRSFAFMEWPRYRQGLWQVLLAEADRSVRSADAELLGADLDAGTLNAARRNADRAGLGRDISLVHEDFAALVPPSTPGLVLCNPPYGIRLGADQDLRDLFRRMGEVYRRRFAGWKGAFLSPREDLARATGLPLERLAELDNGGIAVGLYAASCI